MLVEESIVTKIWKNKTLAIIVTIALSTLVTMVGAANGQSELAKLDAQARQALDKFFDAVMSGESGKVDEVLAPEFQIQRANGSRYNAVTYPDSYLPVIAKMPSVERLVVTSDDDIIVTSYVINVEETLDGAVVQAIAPRLTIFRKNGEDWLVVAHGNFAPIGR